MKRSHNLWRALDRIPIGRAVLAEWRHCLSADFDSVRPLLRPTDQEAGVYPNMDGDDLPLRVVKHGKDDYVAVPELGGPAMRLRRGDVLVHQLDLRRLAATVADAFDLQQEFESVVGERVWRIGSALGEHAARVAVHFCLPSEPSDMQRAIESIHTRSGRAGVFLTPTRRCLRPAIEPLLHTVRGWVVPLEEALLAFDGRRWETHPDLVEQLRTYINPAGMLSEAPLSERAQTVLVAMAELQALDSDRRQATDQIAKRAGCDANSLKPVMTDLRARALIDTRTGRSGGCWLTAAGGARAEKLRRPSETR